jgi:hypothetical protein
MVQVRSIGNVSCNDFVKMPVHLGANNAQTAAESWGTKKSKKDGWAGSFAGGQKVEIFVAASLIFPALASLTLKHLVHNLTTYSH